MNFVRDGSTVAGRDSNDLLTLSIITNCTFNIGRMMRWGDALIGKIIFHCRRIVQGVSSEYILYLEMAYVVLIILSYMYTCIQVTPGCYQQNPVLTMGRSWIWTRTFLTLWARVRQLTAITNQSFLCAHNTHLHIPFTTKKWETLMSGASEGRVAEVRFAKN